MMYSQAGAVTATSLVDAVDAADTAAASSGTGKWLDVRAYEGEILVIQQLGILDAGTVTGKLQYASDANGTGGTDITGATFTAVSTSTDPNTQTCVVDPKKVIGGFLGYVGTVVTGGALISVVAVGKKKYV